MFRANRRKLSGSEEANEIMSRIHELLDEGTVTLSDRELDRRPLRAVQDEIIAGYMPISLKLPAEEWNRHYNWQPQAGS